MRHNKALTLRISEIFYSLQGETTRVGLPTVFVRLTGCPLRCSWCDTTYAFTGGRTLSLEEILAQVAAYTPRYVCVTGGEPLAQKNCLKLLTALCDAGYDVSLETSGTLPVGEVDARVSRIVDLKPPSSGESTKNCWENLRLLRQDDELKFVIADRADYDWMRRIIVEHQLAGCCPILLSPVQNTLSPQTLAEWILADRLPVRLQVQLHRLLWGEAPGK